MDPFARVPDIAVYVMEGGYVVKDCEATLDADSDLPLVFTVTERVTTDKDTLLALVGRLVDAAVARKRAMDDLD